MKRLIFFSLCIFVFTNIFGQKKAGIGSNKVDSTIEQIQISITDSATQQLLQPLTKKKEIWIEKNAPWLVAFVIGILTVLTNIITSYYMRKISRDTIKAQIESSERTSTLNIENSQNLALTQFKSTLKTKNRQDWINEIRQCLAELTTQCKVLNIEFQTSRNDTDRKISLLEKVTFNRNKLLLLLNPSRENHKQLLNAMDSLIAVLDRHFFLSEGASNQFDNKEFMEKNEEVIKTGRTLTYQEWQNIQELLK